MKEMRLRLICINFRRVYRVPNCGSDGACEYLATVTGSGSTCDNHRLPGLNAAHWNLLQLLEVYKMRICSNLMLPCNNLTNTPLRKLGVDSGVLFNRPLVLHLLPFCVQISLPCPTLHSSPIQQSLEVLITPFRDPTQIAVHHGRGHDGKQNAHPCATSAAAHLCHRCYGNRRLRYEELM
jgi:hypothetical protein